MSYRIQPDPNAIYQTSSASHVRLAKYWKFIILGACIVFTAQWVDAAPNSPIPSFEATALSGEKITDAKLIGQSTILIVTPSKGAAEDTRKWVAALRENLNEKAIRIRDVLAVDLPFFMSEADAIGRVSQVKSAVQSMK